jgi:peptide/nickel transport system ATP-binding protein
VVGESGCGKSVTALSLMQLVQRPQGQTVEGEIRFNGADMVYDVVKTPTDQMEKIRGAQISMIFQEPMTSLNPVFRAGHQIDEVIELHNPEMTKEEVKALSLKMIDMVGIANQEGVYMMYPHELSGGMRQRIMIAMALACNPKLIIADEPTTALDVTIQAQILDLLRTLKDKINSSIMLITHDLGVVAEMADYVVVMYAGRIIEKGTADEVFNHPSHPYTVGLMASKPVINKKVDRLYNIPGNVPNPINMPDYCYFKDRCPRRMPICDGVYPREFYLTDSHMAACYLYADADEKARYGK